MALPLTFSIFFKKLIHPQELCGLFTWLRILLLGAESGKKSKCLLHVGMKSLDGDRGVVELDLRTHYSQSEQEMAIGDVSTRRSLSKICIERQNDRKEIIWGTIC